MTPEIVYRNIKNEVAYLLIEKKRKEYSYKLYDEKSEDSKLLVDAGGSFRGDEIVFMLLTDEKNPLEIGMPNSSLDKSEEIMNDVLKGKKVWFTVKKMPLLN